MSQSDRSEGDAGGPKKDWAEYDTLTVRSLQVLDGTRRVCGTVEATDRDSRAPAEDAIRYSIKQGVTIYGVGVSSEGGLVDV